MHWASLHFFHDGNVSVITIDAATRLAFSPVDKGEFYQLIFCRFESRLSGYQPKRSRSRSSLMDGQKNDNAHPLESEEVRGRHAK
jgi:hypothetical protein